MTIKFSVKTQAFYDENTDAIPDDALAVTHEQHVSLIGGMNDGERRVYIGTTGELTLSDSKPSQWHSWDSGSSRWTISDTAQVQVAESEKFRRIHEANDFINSQQWPGKLALGRLNDGEVASFNLWLDYLDELSAINTATAQDIEWPVKPE